MLFTYKQYYYCTQLSQVHNHLTFLEKAMETDLSRARSLSGVDRNTGQLQVAMEKVLFHKYTIVTVSSSSSFVDQAEERLATVEERILEKELLYEQVGRLTEWVQKQVNANKTDTLQLAKKVSHFNINSYRLAYYHHCQVNSYQAQIRDATRKLKALVSELSMYQVI